MIKHPNGIPLMVFADADGNIAEDKELLVVGRSGSDFFLPQPDDFIELPEGSELFTLPNREPLGYIGQTIKRKSGYQAVAAFISPAHTQVYSAAWYNQPNAPTLPLYAYTAVGWLEGKFWVAALRIDTDIRQDCDQFNHAIVQKQAVGLLEKYRGNRLVEHLVNKCGLEYLCPAARNYILNRWECPLPTSPACNANCQGCISFQPEEHEIPSTQYRLDFMPTADEIAQIAIDHINTAPTPIVSFGQGCEGEPLLMWKNIRDAIIKIREQTSDGIININSNASRPGAVRALAEVGLNSIRVSANSLIEQRYMRYYKPNNYNFAAVLQSMENMRKAGGWISINYFVMPGLTDSVQEFEALCKVIEQYGVNMIQWRNFNIDPDWYLADQEITDTGESMGIKNMMHTLLEKYPWLCYGYFNPPADTIKKHLELLDIYWKNQLVSNTH